MAHASWLTKSTSSGSGDGSVSFGAAGDNTGRNSRVTYVTFSSTSAGVDPVTVTATQQGKTEYVEFDEATVSKDSAGGDLTLYGWSNSTDLTFTKSNDGINLTIPVTYTAAGSSVSTNGGTIVGDPGAVERFRFSITFSIPANTTIADKTCIISVAPHQGTASTCQITSSAASANLSVDPTTITLAWNAATQGSSASVNVYSNTSWTVS